MRSSTTCGSRIRSESESRWLASSAWDLHDGSRAIDGHQEGDVADAAAVGAALAEELLARGAGEIIAALRAR